MRLSCALLGGTMPRKITFRLDISPEERIRQTAFDRTANELMRKVRSGEDYRFEQMYMCRFDEFTNWIDK